LIANAGQTHAKSQTMLAAPRFPTILTGCENPAVGGPLL
jgi:hypothetical protein